MWVTYILLSFSIVYSKQYCEPQQACWPTPAEISEFNNTLDPNAKRIFKWTQGEPRISAVPISSPNDQPLYGLGVQGLKALYVRQESDTTSVCFQDNFVTEFCLASSRNFPYNSWNPAFVVFPLNAQHVQSAVKFARDHNICIMVAGTGHDFINRHSCENGIFIRTSLMKNTTWDLQDKKKFGHADGNVKFGPGIVFSEAHNSAAKQKRVISSGWASTVGIIGWSIGGGHGPIAPAYGLGVDNILEVEIVTANASILTVNKVNNSDLYWALRGGGGSTWGIITAITVKAHKIPKGGFTVLQIMWSGDYCSAGKTKLFNFIKNYQVWAPSLGKKWSGLTFIQPSKPAVQFTSCGLEWHAFIQYNYQGSKTDTEFKQLVTKITKNVKPDSVQATNYANWYQFVAQNLEPIYPINDALASSATATGGLASASLNKTMVKSPAFFNLLQSRINDCLQNSDCQRQELYHDITGNVGSPQNKYVSISSAFRTAMIHIVAAGTNQKNMEKYYQLGQASYFSESAYNMTNWQTRYWGTNYKKLLNIKQKYDPQNVFSCHHCVGDEDD